MLTRDGRRRLLEHYDSFPGTACFNGLPFVWPTFHEDVLPTYKRKKSSYRDIRAKLIRLQALLGENGTYGQGNANARRRRPHESVGLLREIFTNNGVFGQKREGTWDAGYLDRIGYAVRQENHCGRGGRGLLVVPQAQNKLRIIPPRDGIKLGVMSHVPYGDHSLTYCLFRLAGF